MGALPDGYTEDGAGEACKLCITRLAKLQRKNQGDAG